MAIRCTKGDVGRKVIYTVVGIKHEATIVRVNSDGWPAIRWGGKGFARTVDPKYLEWK